MDQNYIAELFSRFFDNTITADEKLILSDWIRDERNKDAFEAMLQHSWENYKLDRSMTGEKADALLSAILQKGKVPGSPRTKVIPLHSRVWFRGVAAAILILFTAGSAYFVWQKNENRPQQVAVSDVAPPASNDAVLTLANGEKVILGSVSNGHSIVQGNTNIVKLTNGQIVYGSGAATEGNLFNTLAVPLGSKIASLTLSDGSTVWLNAGSSITYPVAFSGHQRKVKITGEIFFDIAHDATKPFIVTKGDQEIKVLGTQFNVNAYDDESGMKVTLLKGSVQIAAPSGGVILRPGQMASVYTDAPIRVQDHADTEQAIAWKKGIFDFNGADIKTVMRELARWYGLEVTYQDEITDRFHIETSREINLSNMLRILQTTGSVLFQIDGKKVTVMHQN
jgi:ferric-dicitrate binding protein FerR (iron transport regulator)